MSDQSALQWKKDSVLPEKIETLDSPVSSGSLSTLYGLPGWYGEGPWKSFAWLHRPNLEDRKSKPYCVLLCPPFGHEALVCHRAFRHLAGLLAHNGIWTLRFDYPGTGDSLEPPHEDVKVSHWLESLTQGAALLKDKSQASHIVLLGLRMGAMLAAKVSSKIQASGLIMVAPVLTGKSMIRELQAFKALGNGPQQQAPTESSSAQSPARPALTEVTGYALSAPFITELAEISLLTHDSPPPKATLILKRDDLPQTEEKLLQHWEKNFQIKAELWTLENYPQIMPDDAYKANVPYKLWDKILQWLELKKHENHFESPSETKDQAAKVSDKSLPGLPHLQVSHPQWRESTVWHQDMFGILTTPIHQPQKDHFIILSNIGANHRIGPHRLSVKIARELAAEGASVLRFDRAGIGDSPPHANSPENEVYAQGGIESIRQMIQFGQETLKAKSVTLVGLCSGAYFSYHTALADFRVKQLILINPITFLWRKGDQLDVRNPKNLRSTGFYGQKVRNLATWKRLLKGEIHVKRISHELLMRLMKNVSNRSHLFLQTSGLMTPKLSPIGKGFASLAERDVKIHFVFDADEGGLDMIQSHLGPGLRFIKKNCQLKIFYGADHTFTPLASQRELIMHIKQIFQL